MLIDQKHYVIEHVDPVEYYKSRFPRWNPRVKSNVTCVFHKKDSTPSLSINLKNGGARCFASSCQASIGNIVHFESRLRKIDEDVAARNLYAEFIRPIVSVATLQQSLLLRQLCLIRVLTRMCMCWSWIIKPSPISKPSEIRLARIFERPSLH